MWPQAKTVRVKVHILAFKAQDLEVGVWRSWLEVVFGGCEWGLGV